MARLVTLPSGDFHYCNSVSWSKALAQPRIGGGARLTDFYEKTPPDREVPFTDVSFTFTYGKGWTMLGAHCSPHLRYADKISARSRPFSVRLYTTEKGSVPVTLLSTIPIFCKYLRVLERVRAFRSSGLPFRSRSLKRRGLSRR